MIGLLEGEKFWDEITAKLVHSVTSPTDIEMTKKEEIKDIFDKKKVHIFGDKDRLQSKNKSIKSFECHECDARLTSKRNLEGHIISKHYRYALFECMICEEKCFSKESLSAHKLLHTTCNICNKDFRHASKLKRHKKTPNVHHRQDSRAYTCDQCGKAFNLRRDVTRHMEAMHTGKKRRGETCNLCNIKCKILNMEKHLTSRHGGVKIQ